MTEQDVTESLEPESTVVEAMPEQIELEPAEALDAETLEPIERRAETLDEPAETAETAEAFEEAREAVTSEEEPPPKPKRVRIQAKAKPPPKPEAKKRGRPPGSRNIVRAPAPELPAQSAMEQIMSSMRERRQAHQERQHMFFQSFLP